MTDTNNTSFNYDLVIFDWDGTIVDSAAQIVTAMQGAIGELNLPERTDQQIAELIGLGLDDAIGRLFPELPTENVLQMLDGYRRHYGHAIDNPAPIFAGMTELLDELVAQGRTVAVATGKSRKGLDRSLRDTGLGDRFNLTRCADETASKPSPLMLQEILQETGISHAQAVMIGDTEYDMQMATQINMPAIGVAWGVHTSERLVAARADRVCSDVSALHRALQKEESS